MAEEKDSFFESLKALKGLGTWRIGGITYTLRMEKDAIFTVLKSVSKDTMKLYLRLMADRFNPLDPLDSYMKFLKYVKEKKLVVVDDETGERIHPDDFMNLR